MIKFLKAFSKTQSYSLRQFLAFEWDHKSKELTVFTEDGEPFSECEFRSESRTRLRLSRIRWSLMEDGVESFFISFCPEATKEIMKRGLM